MYPINQINCKYSLLLYGQTKGRFFFLVNNLNWTPQYGMQVWTAMGKLKIGKLKYPRTKLYMRKYVDGETIIIQPEKQICENPANATHGIQFS